MDVGCQLEYLQLPAAIALLRAEEDKKEKNKNKK